MLIVVVVVCLIAVVRVAAYGHAERASLLTPPSRLSIANAVQVPALGAIMEGPAITSGFLITSSYFNTNGCSGQPYATEWVQLGYCGYYQANSSDPAAPPASCGSFVSMAVHNVTDSSTGDLSYVLSYNFYKDSACTIPGTGACTQAVNISATCYTVDYQGITSYIGATLVDEYTPPAVGYNEKTYNASNCDGTAYTGIWFEVGCASLSSLLSIYASCPGSSYEVTQYLSSDCSGLAVNSKTVPLLQCRGNVFNEDDSTGVVYGLGYSTTTCTPPPVPTLMPTRMPTVQPTQSSSPVVTFTSNVTLAGLTSPTLNTNAQNAVVSSTAKAMDIAIDKVQYVNAYAVNTATASLRSTGKTAQAVYSVVAVTRTSIALSDTTYTSTATLYASLTTSFVSAVDDGSYAADLVSSGVTELAAVTASDPASSTPVVTTPSIDQGSTSSLSKGQVAGIIVGVVIGVALICGIWFYFAKGLEGSAPGTGTTVVGNAPAAAQTNPVHSGKRGVNDDQL